jgi:hypothetical protein
MHPRSSGGMTIKETELHLFSLAEPCEGAASENLWFLDWDHSYR